jgi:hypothetical protein
MKNAQYSWTKSSCQHALESHQTYLGHMFFICWFTGPATWNSGISEKN